MMMDSKKENIARKLREFLLSLFLIIKFIKLNISFFIIQRKIPILSKIKLFYLKIKFKNKKINFIKVAE